MLQNNCLWESSNSPYVVHHATPSVRSHQLNRRSISAKTHTEEHLKYEEQICTEYGVQSALFNSLCPHHLLHVPTACYPLQRASFSFSSLISLLYALLRLFHFHFHQHHNPPQSTAVHRTTSQSSANREQAGRRGGGSGNAATGRTRGATAIIDRRRRLNLRWVEFASANDSPLCLQGIPGKPTQVDKPPG